MEKYYFILHSEKNGTRMITPSFPTEDYISSFVQELKQDGIRIYDYDVYSEQTRPMAERSLQRAKGFYDRLFPFIIEGERIEVTPLELLRYYSDGYRSKNEHRYAKVVAVHKFADGDCTEMVNERIIEDFLKYGDFKEGESIRFKLPSADNLWNVYITRKRGKYQVKAYQSGTPSSRTSYAQTKEEAILYCLNGFVRETFKNK